MGFIFGFILGIVACGAGLYYFGDKLFKEEARSIVPGMWYYHEDDKKFAVEVTRVDRNHVEYVRHTFMDSKDDRLCYVMDYDGFTAKFKPYSFTKEMTEDGQPA